MSMAGTGNYCQYTRTSSMSSFNFDLFRDPRGKNKKGWCRHPWDGHGETCFPSLMIRYPASMRPAIVVPIVSKSSDCLSAASAE